MITMTLLEWAANLDSKQEMLIEYNGRRMYSGKNRDLKYDDKLSGLDMKFAKVSILKDCIWVTFNKPKDKAITLMNIFEILGDDKIISVTEENGVTTKMNLKTALSKGLLSYEVVVYKSDPLSVKIRSWQL